MIVQYCINLKGMSVRYPYILTVARNWVADGVRTASDVEDKLNEYDKQSGEMQKVLAALQRKGGAELEEKQMLLKWTRSWGYELDAVLTAAKRSKARRLSKNSTRNSTNSIAFRYSRRKRCSTIRRIANALKTLQSQSTRISAYTTNLSSTKSKCISSPGRQKALKTKHSKNRAQLFRGQRTHARRYEQRR